MFGFLTKIFSPLIAPITTVVDNWQKRKTAEVQNELDLKKAVTEAKINHVKTVTDGDIAWENTAIANSGWKSGYLTVIFSLPLVLMFFPGMVPIIEQGFDAINHAPDWYKIAVGSMVAADFGLKKVVDFMKTKQGT